MKRCCRTCDHYRDKLMIEGKEVFVGECWANPPRAQMMLLPNPLDPRQARMEKQTFFPVPNPKFTDVIVCKEYNPRPEFNQ